MDAHFMAIYLPTMMIVILQQQRQAQRRRQMGPRLRIDNQTFLAEVSKRQGKVVRGPKVLWQGYTYLVRGDDYYYYTVSKDELYFPPGVELMCVTQILL